MTNQRCHPHQHPDPTPAEIAARAAEVRRGWTPDVEAARRAAQVGSVVYWPVDWASITEQMQSESMVQTTTHR